MMRQSLGKDTARDILYREWLPSVLTPTQIRSAAILLLLGEEPREISYLDEYSVQRQRVYSVENNHRIYNMQSSQNLGVNLFYKDMSAFLAQNLHSEQCFAYMNLDIEGTFRYNIDPSLTEVLLYCFKYPKTAVVTYTTIGHDEHMLLEGVYSLLLLLWLAPIETEMCVALLEQQYAHAGYEHPFAMILRDMFWIRSHVEHACLASLNQNTPLTSLEKVQAFFTLQDTLWHILKLAVKVPLRFGFLQETVHAVNTHIIHEYLSFDDEAFDANLPHVGIRMADFKHLVYRGDHTWSQRCYFTLFEHVIDSPIPVRALLREMFDMVSRAPLIAINQKGERQEYRGQKRIVDPKTIVWNTKALYTKFIPRKIPEKFFMPLPYPELTSGNKLTEFGITWVRVLAQEGFTIRQMRSVTEGGFKGVSDAVLRGYITAARKNQ